jgi:DNA polymerase-3 subunit epsilon|tara:strand:+ start:187 stop:1047 length:861 start_codon:yes stop_codon:yes gene_type:complete
MTFIKELIVPENKIELRKFDGNTLSNQIVDQSNANSSKICILDLETTGLDKANDKIIELAVKLMSVDNKTGDLNAILNQYESFQDPEEHIDEKVSMVNGITNDMVDGHAINWDSVEEIMESADLIIAHNAGFDRAFMDRYLPISKEKIWICSVNDVDWLSRGFTSSKQELLCIWHGFYYDSHRAMSDVDALINLLAHPSNETKKPVLDLIENASIPTYKVSAINSPYETKDILKSNSYFWNGDQKYWWKNLLIGEIESEKRWLADNVYGGNFMGIVEEISLTDKYK